MYKATVRALVRHGIHRLNEGDPRFLLRLAAPTASIAFPGENSWSTMYRSQRKGRETYPTHRGIEDFTFQTQENQIIKPTPFWPMKGEGGTFGAIDFRVYTLHPGKLGAFFKLYETEGLATQVKHLGNCLGFYQSDIGPQHQVIHLWGYADIADRARRRGAMQADPAWNAYLSKAALLFSRMENSILRPAPFWTARGP